MDDAPASRSRDSRSGVSWALLFAGLGLSVVLALGVAAYIYVRYVRYVPHATEHLPESMVEVLRLDVEQAVVYDPFRKHLLPLLEWGRSPKTSRATELEKLTSVEVGVDLRELVVARDGEGEWLVLLGGHFRQDGVARGLERLLAAEGVRARFESAPERLLLPGGQAVAVAADGVVAIASSDRGLRAALARQSPESPLSGSTGPALTWTARPCDSCKSGFLRARLELWPGQEFPGAVEVVGSDARGGSPPPVTLEEAEALLSGKGRDFSLLPVNIEWRLEPAPGGHVVGRALLSRAAFDEVVSGAAANVRKLILGGLVPSRDHGSSRFDAGSAPR